MVSYHQPRRTLVLNVLRLIGEEEEVRSMAEEDVKLEGALEAPARRRVQSNRYPSHSRLHGRTRVIARRLKSVLEYLE